MKIIPRLLPAKTKKMAYAILVFLTCTISIFLFMRVPFLARSIQSIEHDAFLSGTFLKNIYAYIFTSRSVLLEERDYYRDLSASLAKKIQETSALEAQVRELSTLLEYSSASTNTTFIANIISSTFNQQSRSLYLDLGSEDGMRSGLAVIIENGHLIGIIDEVDVYRSRVKLIQDQSSKIPSSVISTNKTSGLIEGSGGFILKMNYIPQSETINVDDVVVSSGLDGNIPKGLIIGVVSEIIHDVVSPFQQAYIEPFYDISEYSTVVVLDQL